MKTEINQYEANKEKKFFLLKNKKRFESIRIFIIVGMIVLLGIVVLHMSKNGIKSELYRFVIFVRNIIVRIISKEFLDLSDF